MGTDPKPPISLVMGLEPAVRIMVGAVSSWEISKMPVKT